MLSFLPLLDEIRHTRPLRKPEHRYEALEPGQKSSGVRCTAIVLATFLGGGEDRGWEDKVVLGHRRKEGKWVLGPMFLCCCRNFLAFQLQDKETYRNS